MKRILVLLLVTMVIFPTLLTRPANADGFTIEKEEDTYYVLRVLRPKISLSSEKGGGERIAWLTFGERLQMLSYEGKYCKVKDANENVGYVYTGYVDYTMAAILWFKGDHGGVSISPRPGMQPTDFGYAAGGTRMSERAIVMYSVDSYLYVITEEGCSGFVYQNDPDIVVCMLGTDKNP